MADEENEGEGASRVDLNLYLGLPQFSSRRVLDLGSDLALGSLPLLSLSSTEESCAFDTEVRWSGGGMSEPSDALGRSPERRSGDSPYSPSNVDFGPFFSLEDHEPFISLELINDDSVDLIPHLPNGFVSPPRLFPASHASYSPQDALLPPSPSSPTEGDFHVQLSLSLGWDDLHNRSPLRQESQHQLQFRFRRIIELNNRRRLRRFRSSLPSVSSSSTFIPVPRVSEQPLHQINGKKKDSDAELAGKVRKRKTMADFECNLCLNLAREPVVTSCGHLFCWPCLYMWLNIKSRQKECSVCKEEVTESKIIPIYGRGCTETNNEKKKKVDVSGGEANLYIPPRPRGNRLESFRQRLRYRRLGEDITSSWRRLVDEGIFERGPPVQQTLDLDLHSSIRRLRASMVQREDPNLEAPVNGTGEPLSSTWAISHDDSEHPFSMWAAVSTDLNRVVESISGDSEMNYVSLSSPGDLPVANAPAGPGRSDGGPSSSSLDVDGGALHLSKRRLI